MAMTSIHPGEHLAEELKELGMSVAELSQAVTLQQAARLVRVPGIGNLPSAECRTRNTVARFSAGCPP